MFTGIVEGTGSIVRIIKKENLYVLTLRPGKLLKGVKIGDSVSVDGVCLTVTHNEQGALSFDLMKETLDATIMKHYEPGRNVNLERSLRVGDRLGGHFVTGHIDGVGILTKIVTLPNYVEWRITCPSAQTRYVVPKGSVTLDGVSLTVGKVGKSRFSVYLIPHTLDVTTFGEKKSGDRLNIETDILAKYVLFNKGKGNKGTIGQ